MAPFMRAWYRMMLIFRISVLVRGKDELTDGGGITRSQIRAGPHVKHYDVPLGVAEGGGVANIVTTPALLRPQLNASFGGHRNFEIRGLRAARRGSAGKVLTTCQEKGGQEGDQCSDEDTCDSSLQITLEWDDW